MPNPCIQNGRQLLKLFFHFTIGDRQFAFAWTLFPPPSELEQIVPSSVISAILSPLSCVWIFPLKTGEEKKKEKVNEKLLPFLFLSCFISSLTLFVLKRFGKSKAWEEIVTGEGDKARQMLWRTGGSVGNRCF